jgi:cytochrome P450
MAAVISLEDAVAAYANLEDAAIADRWHLYGRLREEAPIFRFGRTVLVTRYDDVSRVLLDDAVFHTPPAPSLNVPEEAVGALNAGQRAMFDAIVDHESRWMVSANGERHARLRGLATRVFAPQAIASMRDRIDEVANGMLDRLTGTIEFKREFANELPLTIISEVLDVPVEWRRPLYEAAHGIVMTARTGMGWRTRFPAGLEEAHGHFAEMRRVMRALLREKRDEPTTPILANLIAALDDGDVDEADVVVTMQLLFSAGHSTTRDLLTNGLHALLTNPEQWATLCDDPSLAPAAIEEILRYRAPGQDVERVARKPIVLQDFALDEGQHLTVVLGSANFDERSFADPERFDIGRSDAKRHLAFSRGVHFCVGAGLARMESTIALEALARRFPGTTLAGGDCRWLPNAHRLELSALPVGLAA